MPSGEDLLSLQEAAERLKIHYMTAYRWVRRGELPAFKTGGRLRVRRSDLDRFLLEREVEVALPSDVPGRTDWASHLDRFAGHLLAGASVDAAALVRKVITDGAPAGATYLNLLTPALHRMGAAWAAGDITIAEEHRATAICAVIMGRLTDLFRRRGPDRGAAVTLTPPGERHALASAMVADFLRAWGYEVHHLGASVPAGDLAVFLTRVRVDVVCLSVTMRNTGPRALPEMVEAARPVRENEPPAVVVGGQGADADSAARAGALHVPELAELGDCLERLGHDKRGTA